MTNEEAKDLYNAGVAKFNRGAYEEALIVFNRLDAERPNSRHVQYYRVKCLVATRKLGPAQDLYEKLEGWLEADRLLELKNLLVQERAKLKTIAAPQALEEDPPEESIFIIDSVVPVSTERAAVQGHVQVGRVRPGDALTLFDASGTPVAAPIIRLGTEETPLRLARRGEQVAMLLQATPELVRVGSPATVVSGGGQESAAIQAMRAVPGQEAEKWWANLSRGRMAVLLLLLVLLILALAARFFL